MTKSGQLMLTLGGRSTAACAIDVQDVTLNIEDYGAKGNGVDDDRPAFLKALQILKQQRGGTLLIPAGVYPIHGGLETKIKPAIASER